MYDLNIYDSNGCDLSTKTNDEELKNHTDLTFSE